MSPHGPASSLLPVTFSLYPKTTHREGLGGPCLLAAGVRMLPGLVAPGVKRGSKHSPSWDSNTHQAGVGPHGPHKDSLNSRFGSHGVKYLNGAPSLKTTIKTSRASPHQTQEDTGPSTCAQGPRPGSLHRRPNAGHGSGANAERSDTGSLGQAQPVPFRLSPHPSWLVPIQLTPAQSFQMDMRQSVSS